MNRRWIVLAGAAVVIVGGFFLRQPQKQADDLAPTEVALNSSKKTQSIGKVDGAKVETGKVETVTSDVSRPQSKKETNLKKLEKEGYIENPDDPYTMIKRVKTTDGKETTYVVPKDPDENESFEPTERTVKTAEETLESRRNENPESEIEEMHPLDESDRQSMMLTGMFRDDANDIELRFSKLYDISGRPQGKDKICFVAPKLGYNMENNITGKVRTDGTGYGLLQLNSQLYIRVAWSFEKKRILHGELLKAENGETQIIKKFSAQENSKGMKYCN